MRILNYVWSSNVRKLRTEEETLREEVGTLEQVPKNVNLIEEALAATNSDQ